MRSVFVLIDCRGEAWQKGHLVAVFGVDEVPPPGLSPLRRASARQSSKPPPSRRVLRSPARPARSSAGSRARAIPAVLLPYPPRCRRLRAHPHRHARRS